MHHSKGLRAERIGPGLFRVHFLEGCSPPSGEAHTVQANIMATIRCWWRTFARVTRCEKDFFDLLTITEGGLLIDNVAIQQADRTVDNIALHVMVAL